MHEHPASLDDIKTPLDWWRYHADFFQFPALFAFLVWYDFERVGLEWFGALLLGFVFFTFVEYWVHRSILHGAFYHGTHEDHHLKPEAHVFFPLYYVPGAFLFIFAEFAFAGWLVGASEWLAMYAGFVLGYVWFTVMHHLLHHSAHAAGSYLHRFAMWHLVHHSSITWNYGITTNIWDRVFRTYRDPASIPRNRFHDERLLR